MEIAFAVTATLLCIALAYTIIRLAVFKTGLKEINETFSFALKGDTNAKVSLSSNDKTLKNFANALNARLTELRQKELTFINGDREIKGAIANVSHDLRTPLTAICGYLDLIKDEKDPEKIRRYLDIVRDRALALRQLTEELFSYTVACDIGGRSDVRTLSLGAVLEETLLGFYEALNERGITPDLSFCDGVFECIADKNALVRIFENIIGNAVKHSEGDFAVSLNEDGSVEFSNRAPTLDSVSVGRLFDRFFTVESGRTSTGLGLSIAKNLTQSLGGDISARLENGVLTVRVAIPCKRVK